MNKVVLFTSKDEEVKKLQESMFEIKKNFESQIEFFAKRASALAKEVREKEKNLWEEIERHLIMTRQMPSEFNRSEHCFEIDHENGILWCKDKKAVQAQYYAELLRGLE